MRSYALAEDRWAKARAAKHQRQVLPRAHYVFAEWQAQRFIAYVKELYGEHVRITTSTYTDARPSDGEPVTRMRLDVETSDPRILHAMDSIAKKYKAQSLTSRGNRQRLEPTAMVRKAPSPTGQYSAIFTFPKMRGLHYVQAAKKRLNVDAAIREIPGTKPPRVVIRIIATDEESMRQAREWAAHKFDGHEVSTGEFMRGKEMSFAMAISQEELDSQFERWKTLNKPSREGHRYHNKRYRAYKKIASDTTRSAEDREWFSKSSEWHKRRAEYHRDALGRFASFSMTLTRKQFYLLSLGKQRTRKQNYELSLLTKKSGVSCDISPLISVPYKRAKEFIKHPIDTLKHPGKAWDKTKHDLKQGYGNQIRKDEGLPPISENDMISVKDVIKHHKTHEDIHRAGYEKFNKSEFPGTKEVANEHKRKWHHHAGIRTRYEAMDRAGKTHVSQRQYQRDSKGRFASFSMSLVDDVMLSTGRPVEMGWKKGAAIGAVVGLLFFGVGALPGAIVGGLIQHYRDKGIEAEKKGDQLVVKPKTAKQKDEAVKIAKAHKLTPSHSKDMTRDYKGKQRIDPDKHPYTRGLMDKIQGHLARGEHEDAVRHTKSYNKAVTQMNNGTWDESKHPRDQSGKFD